MKSVILKTIFAIAALSTLGLVASKDKITSSFLTTQSSVTPNLLMAETKPFYSVERITDGDSIWINKNGKKTEVRLACIDAPEGKQFWGQQATNRLAELSPPGQKIELRETGRDRYNRTVAEIFVAGQSVNLQMVQEGNAVVYLQYLNNCASNKNQYLQAEEYAKIQKFGFWNQQNPVMPWDFRRGKRSNQPTYSPFPVNPSNLPKNYNCPDFTTQAEAQKIFNKYPNDLFDLDRDSDGIACENLP
ncbi:thermonuclease family protein [Nostoc sp.]|uniref:thermonuclease family protein n=1 Tax=Nostoc sp. TaxID=1180 RepID=UPI002FF87D7F